MSKLTALNPISTPLTSTTLIEASAGTGKTYTMASLYIRLLLQAGENNFPRPLTVQEILVVTFTEASTQELKERIRQRIHLCKQQLMDYQQIKDQITEQNKKQIFQQVFVDNPFLEELLPFIEDIELAILRLRLAEQNMDLAAIYTIHGFCHRMLMQYAFYSKIHFELELLQDQTSLIQRAVNQFWREHFYPLPYLAANFIHHYLTSPQNVMDIIFPYINGESLNVEINRPHLLAMSLTELLEDQVQTDLQKINQFKQQWLEKSEEIQQVIEQAVKNKSLKAASFRSNHIASRMMKINQWAQDKIDFSLPDTLLTYFSQQRLNQEYRLENANEVSHPLLRLVDELQQIDFQTYYKIVLYHYIQGVNQYLVNYKQHHAEKGFDDLLRLLRNALLSENGDLLAQRIRQQYPFAMIDEFQDTDARQYQIFAKLYTEQANCGFIMIGDPKQAIYKFRGADIFTYLSAAAEAQRFTLDKNYRSTPRLIEAVNQIFDFPSYPFLYDQIGFDPVKAGKTQPQFFLNNEAQEAIVFHIGGEHEQLKNGRLRLNKTKTQQLFAEACADSIVQWLSSEDQSAVQNSAIFVKTDNTGKVEKAEKVKDNDIAVLVENWWQAQLIQQSLADRGIASVYLSDKSNVFDTAEAKELTFILAACLDPSNTNKVITAISTSLFALTMNEIYQSKTDDYWLEQWIGRFETYQRTWFNQGILAMLYQLFLYKKSDQLCILQKLRLLPHAERRITDLLHLAEILQQASPLHESEANLLRWFERQIEDSSVREQEQQLRLESENQRVKIVTIHKSKGLEYGLVWLPFIAFSTLKSNSLISTYYNENKESNYWDMDELNSHLADQENMAEKMRLLYVALTRAKYQINIALPKLMYQEWTAIWYALSRGQIGQKLQIDQADESLKLIQQLDSEQIVSKPIELAEIDRKSSLAHGYSEQLKAQRFEREIDRDWGISSFSSLIYSHQRNQSKQDNSSLYKQSAVSNSQIFDSAKEQDSSYLLLTKPTDNPQTEDWQQYPLSYRPVDFPQGRYVGTILHNFFEKQPFNQPIRMEAISKICQSLQLESDWEQPLSQWLQDVLQTPLLADGFSLAQIKPQDCLKEMQFYFNVESGLDLAKFNQILQQFHPLFDQPLQFEHVKGMLRGFIDLVFRHQGKYYILDYKSNLLGYQYQDYNNISLRKVMQQQHYDLQYILYTLALHRYLKLKDKNYHYESHFGGVIYGFLRGMNGKNTDYGVFFERPSAQLIQQLGDLFDA